MQSSKELESKDPLKKIREDFEKVKEQETHRKVKLIYKSCCGCGCDDIEVTRTVPYDSPLKNGDRIKKLEKGDKW